MTKLIPKAQTGNKLLYKQDATQNQSNAEDKIWGLQRHLDSQNLSELEFNEKYKMKLHPYKWEHDPVYKQKLLEASAQRQAQGKEYKFDLPWTDNRSKNYGGNPNLKLIPGKANISKEDNFLATTSLTAPLVPIKNIGLINNFGKYLTTQTPLKYTYKLNPFAFKPKADMGYRVLGEGGFKDAIDTGVLRAKPAPNPTTSGTISLARNLNRNPNTGRLQPLLDRPYFADGFIDKRYGADYIAEVNKKINNLVPIPTHKGIAPSQAGNISLENATLYKQDWLRGYKKIDVKPETQNMLILKKPGSIHNNVEKVKPAPKVVTDFEKQEVVANTLKARERFMNDYLADPEFERRMRYYVDNDDKAIEYGVHGTFRTPFKFVDENPGSLGTYDGPVNSYDKRYMNSYKHSNPQYIPKEETAIKDYGLIKIPYDYGHKTELKNLERTTWHELGHSLQSNFPQFIDYMKNNNVFRGLIKSSLNDKSALKRYDLMYSNSPQKWVDAAKAKLRVSDKEIIDFAKQEYYKVDPREIHSTIIEGRAGLDKPFKTTFDKDELDYFHDLVSEKMGFEKKYINKEKLKQLLNSLPVTLPATAIGTNQLIPRNNDKR